MFYRWIRGLSLSLCVFGTAAQAQEVARPAPMASLGKPIAVARPAAPVVTLGRPVAIASPTPTDAAVQPVSFTARDPLAPLTRAAAPEGQARRMPLDDTAVSQWRRAEPAAALGSIASPPGESLPIGPTPLPNGGGPIVSSPMAGPSPFGGGCADGACFPGAAFAPARCGSRLWVGVDYLLWSVRGDKTPPLVTTGSPADAVPGAIGMPGTQVLFGGSGINNDPRSGARVNLVYWFGEERCWGLDVSGFYLPEQQDKFSTFSTGIPVLARPIVDFLPSIFNTSSLFNQAPNSRFGLANVERVADPANGTTFPDPGALAGAIEVVHKSTLWGYETNLRRGLFCGDNFNCDLLFGYRQLGLDESLNITERLAVTEAQTGLLANGTPVILTPSGTRIVVNDRFTAQNRFYGGQVGFDSEWRVRNWSLGLRSKVALGSTEQFVDISGFRTSTSPAAGAASRTVPGGLLALPGTNIGRYYRSVFSVVPEVGLTLGYQFKPWLRGTAGYNFLYWNDVARPGRAIDPGVNRNFQVDPTLQTSPLGTARPAFNLNGSDLWVHGLTLGLEARF